MSLLFIISLYNVISQCLLGIMGVVYNINDPMFLSGLEPHILIRVTKLCCI